MIAAADLRCVRRVNKMDGAVRLSSGEVSRRPPLRACTTPAGLDAQAARRGGDFGQERGTRPEVSYLTRKTFSEKRGGGTGHQVGGYQEPESAVIKQP